jgi:hypothetical protein
MAGLSEKSNFYTNVLSTIGKGGEDWDYRPDTDKDWVESTPYKKPKDPRLDPVKQVELRQAARKSYKKQVYKQLGGNPNRISERAALAEFESYGVRQLWNKAFKNILGWHDRNRMNPEQRNYWNKLLLKERARVSSEVGDLKAAKTKAYTDLMADFDRDSNALTAAWDKKRTAEAARAKADATKRKALETKKAKATADTAKAKAKAVSEYDEAHARLASKDGKLYPVDKKGKEGYMSQGDLIIYNKKAVAAGMPTLTPASGGGYNWEPVTTGGFEPTQAPPLDPARGEIKGLETGKTVGNEAKATAEQLIKMGDDDQAILAALAGLSPKARDAALKEAQALKAGQPAEQPAATPTAPAEKAQLPKGKPGEAMAAEAPAPAEKPKAEPAKEPAKKEPVDTTAKAVEAYLKVSPEVADKIKKGPTGFSANAFDHHVTTIAEEHGLSRREVKKQLRKSLGIESQKGAEIFDQIDRSEEDRRKENKRKSKKAQFKATVSEQSRKKKEKAESAKKLAAKHKDLKSFTKTVNDKAKDPDSIGIWRTVSKHISRAKDNNDLYPKAERDMRRALKFQGVKDKATLNSIIAKFKKEIESSNV